MTSDIVDYETKKYLQELDSFGLPPPLHPIYQVTNNIHSPPSESFTKRLNDLNIQKQKKAKLQKEYINPAHKFIQPSSFNKPFTFSNSKPPPKKELPKKGGGVLIRKDYQEETIQQHPTHIVLPKPVTQNSMVARLSEADKKEIIGEDQIKMLRETVLRETRPKNATLSSSAVKSDQIRQYIKEQDLKSQNQYSLPNHTKSSLSINVNSNLNGHTKYNGGQMNGIIKDSNGNAPSPSSTLSTENGRWSNASSTSSSLNSSQTKSKEDDYISPQAKFYFHGDDYGKDGSGEFDVRHQQVPIKTILNEGPPKDSLYSKPWKKVEFNLPPKQTPQERRLPRVDPDAVYERPPPHMTQPNRDRYVIGDCGKCSLPIFNTESNTFALEQLFHTTCFTCTTCSLPLKGKQFYTLKDKCYCEADYLKESARESVKCHECGHNITDVVISALGKSFCPECFRCSRCRVLLDGQPFTVDKKGDIYCKQDYHDLFSPKCARCHEPIVSDNEVTEFIRVPNLNNQDYHIQCYTCECCHKNLKSDSEKKCYPIGNVILCLTCNKIWARTGGTNTPITDL